MICVPCCEVAERMYARKNPVARALIYKRFEDEVRPVAGGFVAIVEEEDGYLQYCTFCNMAMTVEASFNKNASRVQDYIFNK